MDSNSHPQLAALSAELAACGRVRRFAEGEVLYRQGTRPRAMLCVLEGELRLVRHSSAGRTTILQRSRGGFIAEASLEASAYHCDIVAAEAGRLLAIPLPDFRRALDEDGGFRRNWIRHLAGEVRRLRALNERLQLNSAADRILHAIDSTGRDGVLTLEGSRKAWAADLGLSHEALYRTIRRMVDAGTLSVDGQCIALAGDTASAGPSRTMNKR
jgi:CRP-like cAMP-binding protein